MIRLFCGFDQREAIGHAVFCESVIDHATAPVSLTPIGSRGMPVGTNEFTFSRFLVPWMCDFRGHAIFMDGADMLMLDDIAVLDSLFDDRFAVQVVRHANYETRHPIKYRGTAMECPNLNYARKNWASVMLLNCAHPYWAALTPDTLARVAGLSLLQFGGLRLDDRGADLREVGELPDRWNRIVDEGHPVDGAAVLHWTAGIPAFPAYADAPGADLWRATRDRVLEVC